MKYDFLPIDYQARDAKKIRHDLSIAAKRGRDMKKYYERKEAGLCVHCGAPAAEGKSLCQPCLDYERKRNKMFFDGRRARHECIECGEPLSEDEKAHDYVMCDACRARRRVWREKRKARQEERSRSEASLTASEGGSDTARYKAIGNGMAQPCADFILRRIAEEAGDSI